MNAERARVIEANPALAARSLQMRQVWAEAIAAELAARRGLPTPDERDRLGGLLVIAILLSAFREWSLVGDRPGRPARGRRPHGILGGRDAAAVNAPRIDARRAEARMYSRKGDRRFQPTLWERRPEG